MKLRIILSLFIVSFLGGCIQFSTQFERVEDDKIRLIDFIYEPPEAAPGDTVILRAVFAGKEIKPEAINWRVSYKLIKTLRGTDTALEEQPLECVSEQCTFSENTSCISVRFVIPQDCIVKSPMIKENLAALYTDELRNLLPDGFNELSIDTLAQWIDYLSKLTLYADSAFLARISDSLLITMPDVMSQFPLILQLLTVQIRIFADVTGSHRIQSDYSVCYNPRFCRIKGSGIYTNRNPVIDSVGIYKVKGGGVLKFDRQNEETEYIKLGNSKDSAAEVVIDKGYTYFIEVAAGGRDTVFTMGDITAGKASSKVEDFSAEWMFKTAKEETAGLSPNDLMNISVLGDLYGILTPPRKKKVERFIVWVQVTDSKLGIMHRSQGSNAAEVHGRFVYTEAYLNQFK